MNKNDQRGELSLKGKNILFIGGTGGIGRPTVELLLKEGANVITTGLPQNPNLAEIEMNFTKIVRDCNSGSKFNLVKFDITREENIKALFKTVNEVLGKIDHLVITAGVSHLGKLIDVTRQEWDLVFDVNVWGILRTIQLAIPNLNKDAHIIVIGSDVGLGKPSHDIPLYSISKTALHSIVSLLAQELPAYGISISGIAPYNTPPGMSNVYRMDANKIICEAEDCNTPDWGNLPPTGKFIDTKSISNMILLLLKSSSDFNGTMIPITGGYGLTVS